MQVSEPEIRILQPGDEAALEAFALPRIESSMFLVGNMRLSGLVDHGLPYQGTYAAAWEEGQIAGIVAHFWNRVLIFQAPAYLRPLWRAAVRVSGRPVGGLIGPNDQVSAVKAALGIEEARIQLDQVEKLYSLALEDLIVPAPLRSGQVRGRRMEPGDLDVVTEWNIAYSIEAIQEQDGPELRQRCRAVAERNLKEKSTWVLEREGTLVACSSFNTAIAEAVQIGGVYTPPEMRRRGYARAVVASSLLDARAEGVGKAILFTGEHNVAAQRAYESLGFRHIGHYRLVLLSSPLEGVV
jgi:ribosomal protein S18 acetylase RimI-like enzyme